MTDRIKGYTVCLKQNIREDDAENIKNAISMIKGVISVTEHVADHDHYFAMEQVSLEFREKLWELLSGEKKK